VPTAQKTHPRPTIGSTKAQSRRSRFTRSLAHIPVGEPGPLRRDMRCACGIREPPRSRQRAA
jgi:hypothetical protein